MIFDGGLPLGQTDVADATGTAVLSFDQVPPEEAWFVAALLLASTPPRASAVWVATASGIFAGFGSGAFSRISGIGLLGGDTLQVTVTGLQPGDSVAGSVPSGGGFRASDALDVLQAMSQTASSSAFALASGENSIGQPPAPAGFTHLRLTGTTNVTPFVTATGLQVSQIYLHHLAVIPEGAAPQAGFGRIVDRSGNQVLRFSAGNTSTMTPLPMGGILFDTRTLPPPPGVFPWLNAELGAAADTYHFYAIWTQL